MITTATLTARGGAGGDDLRGGAGNDALFGEEGDDNLTGNAGNDTLDGGPGREYLLRRARHRHRAGRPDQRHGGSLGRAATSTSAAPASNAIDYRDRTAPVTITLDGVGRRRRGGRGRQRRSPSSARCSAAPGMTGSSATTSATRLIGNAGNDTLTGGKAEDRIEGNEGDDVIDSRDGRYDSIDCGPGFDVVYGDPQDSTTGLRAGAGPGRRRVPCARGLRPQRSPRSTPGAPEIYGNNADENCDGRARLYLRVSALISYRTLIDRKHARVRFTRLVVQGGARRRRDRDPLQRARAVRSRRRPTGGQGRQARLSASPRCSRSATCARKARRSRSAS